jgi:hypothetical protein
MLRPAISCEPKLTPRCWLAAPTQQPPFGFLVPDGRSLSGGDQGDHQSEYEEGETEIGGHERAVSAEPAEGLLDSAVAADVVGGRFGDGADEDGEGEDGEQPARLSRMPNGS